MAGAVGDICVLPTKCLTLITQSSSYDCTSVLFSFPGRVKAKWAHTGWLAIKTTVYRTTAWFATGIPTWPGRRRQWQAVRYLWAMWVQLVQYSGSGFVLFLCGSNYLQPVILIDKISSQKFNKGNVISQHITPYWKEKYNHTPSEILCQWDSLSGCTTPWNIVFK